MKEIYQILSNDQNQESRLSQIANNLANVNTIGFKRDEAVFSQYLDSSLKQLQGAGQTAAPNPADSVWPSQLTGYTNFQQGSFQPTGQKLDVAIDGDGFFKVRTAQGDFYTRAGSFQLNVKNELVTQTGNRVLSTKDNPIVVNPAIGTPEITTTGDIKLNQAVVGRLAVVKFQNTRQLEKVGDGLFRAPDGVTAQPVAKPLLRPEVLESSNVNVIDEMVRMIDADRSSTVGQKVVQTIDDLVSQLIQSARSG